MSATGKVPLGRLPFDVREQICRRLRDKQSGRQINEWLVASGLAPAPYNDTNYTNFRKGSYREWLDQQARLDEIRRRAEETRRELEAGGFSVLDKSIYELAERLSDSDMAPGKAAAAVAALKNAVTLSERTKIQALRADIAAEQSALNKKKFARDTCQLFLKWYNNRQATDVAGDSSLSSDQKTEMLGKIMFGEDW